MRIQTDWHIHSQNSCDCASMEVATLIQGAAVRGVTDYGLTDHLHTPYNLPDLEASRREFDAATPPPGFHFGVEVSVVSAWELAKVAAGEADQPVYGIRAGGPPGADLALALDEAVVSAYGIEYAVGGTHWPMYVPVEREAIIRDYHRQNLFLATHPLVDIVAHPWWWHGPWQNEDGTYIGDPWLDDFGKIPRSMHEEFAAAARAHGTAVEINLHAMILTPVYPESFKHQYVEYLALLQSLGVQFSLGSDCHGSLYDVDLEAGARWLEPLGLSEADVWSLPPRTPRVGSRRTQETLWERRSS